MTANGDANSRESFEAAVRSFTAAEVALGEFVTAAQRFRSASEAMERAQTGLELTREPILESLEVMTSMAAELERTSASMGSTAKVLAELDPNRFWSSFSEVKDAVSEVKGAVATHASRSADQHAELRRLAMQTRLVGATAAILSAASIGGIVLLLTR